MTCVRMSRSEPGCDGTPVEIALSSQPDLSRVLNLNVKSWTVPASGLGNHAIRMFWSSSRRFVLQRKGAEWEKKIGMGVARDWSLMHV